MNLRFYLFVSGVNQGNERERDKSKISLLVLFQGFGSFHLVFSPSLVIFKTLPIISSTTGSYQGYSHTMGS